MNPITISPALAISETGFLFLSSTGETFTVNALAKQILRLLQAGTDHEEIVRTITEEFDVTPEQARRDYQDFISHLKHLRLAEEV